MNWSHAFWPLVFDIDFSKDLDNYDVHKDSIFASCSFIIMAEAGTAPLQELLIPWLLDENCNVKRKSRFQS